MNTKCKVRIYKLCVGTVMKYAIKTRAETTATKKLQRSTQLRTLRSLADYTLRDRKNPVNKRGLQDI